MKHIEMKQLVQSRYSLVEKPENRMSFDSWPVLHSELLPGSQMETLDLVITAFPWWKQSDLCPTLMPCPELLCGTDLWASSGLFRKGSC